MKCLIIALLLGLSSCSNSVYSLRSETISSAIQYDDIISTFTRTGPGAVFVETHLVNEISVIEFNGETTRTTLVRSSYDPDSQESAAMTSSIFSGLFGLLAGMGMGL